MKRCQRLRWGVHAEQPPPTEDGVGDSEGPTREVKDGEELRLGAQTSTDEIVKASLLAGTGGRIGRFHVLRLIGEGGMGMVFAAYDEELDRKVAIKLLRNLPGEGSIGRSRLLREAQALARLSHPNVVTVYEVGEYERQVFIAMEFVLGDTLHKWLRGGPRGWRDVVRVFIEAGRGLAVAHAAEILHRDFKPANVLLGEDGRVRVLDFGLALAQGRSEPELVSVHPVTPGPGRGALTEVGSVLGTPAYMAPERFIAGRPVDARADQFSFCVALYEGLYGERPFPGREYAELRETILRGTIPEPPRASGVPKWLRKVVARGLALDPADRHANMESLLVALQRDPERGRRLALAGLGVGVVLIAGGYGLAQATGGLEVCPDARGRLDWEPRRAAVEEAFLDQQASYAADSWTRISSELDAYVEQWAAGHLEACESHARGEQSDALLDLRMACLERRRGEFDAIVTRLAEADADTVRSATAAVGELPAPRLCADTRALGAAVPLPEDPAAAAQVVALRGRLAEVRAALSTRKLAAADEVVGEVMPVVEALAYRPLLAEALVVRGELEDMHGAYEPSRVTYTEALWLADTCRDDELVARAMAGVILALDRQARYDEALTWWRHAHAVIARLGEGSPGHTRLLRAFAAVLLRLGRERDAVQVMAEALRLDQARPDADQRAVVLDLKGLGTAQSVSGNHAEARKLLERALALVEELEGRDHPNVAAVANNLATALSGMGEAKAAQALYERAVTITEAALGPDHPELSIALTNLGASLGEGGDLVGARKLLERALAVDERVLGREHPELVPGLHFLGMVALDSNDLGAAHKHATRALAIRERHFGADSRQVAVSRSELGLVLYLQGKLPAAIKELERAISGMVADPDPGFPEALPQARFALAEALQDSGKHKRARTLAMQAMAEYQAIGSEPTLRSVKDIQAWLAAKPRRRGAK